MLRGASRRRVKGQVPRPSKRQAFKFRVSLPEGRNGVARVVIATPAGEQADLAGVGIAVHDHHVLPLLAVVLWDVRLVAAAVPGAPLRVVDGVHALGEQPRQNETFVREGLGATHRGDVLALPEGRQVGDDDPLDDGVVGCIAVEEPEAVHRLVLERHRGGVEQLPAPVIGVNTPHRPPVPLEGERHPFGPFAEADAERTVGVLALGPGRGGPCETVEDRLGDAPLTPVVLGAQGGELLVRALLEGVAVARLADERFHESRVCGLANPGRVLDGHTRVGEDANGGVQFCQPDFDETFHDGIVLLRHQ